MLKISSTYANLKMQTYKNNPMIKSKQISFTGEQNFDSYTTNSDTKEKTKRQAEFFDSKAVSLMQANKFDEAIESLDSSIALYSELIKIAPEDKKINKLIGNAHHRKGKCYQMKARLAGPTLKREKFNTKAQEEYTLAIHYVPNSANSYYERGMANLSLSNKEEAVSDFKKAIEINPQISKFHEALSKVLIQSDDQASIYEGVNELAMAIYLKQDK